jgi:rare lipoprotein A
MIAQARYRFSRLLCTLLLAGCASTPVIRPAPVQVATPPAKPNVPAPASPPALPPAKPNQIPQQYGGYYQDDGPILAVPYDLDALPEPVPKFEPLHRFANRPYAVFGQTYTPLSPTMPFSQEGIASWYGRKFNGKNTASGEPYDMFKLTAAHPTLPVPSYARVTNLDNGKSVIVRINDRGPFHKNRVMDMSYAAAYRLGYQNKGSARVHIDALIPGVEEAPAMAALPLPTETPPTLAGPDPVAVLAATAEAELTPSAQPTSIPPAQPVPAGAVWLQLGAFGSQAAAESFKAHVADDVGTVGAGLSISTTAKLWRVRVGPFANRDEAVRAADKLAAVFPQRPVIAH